MGLIICMCEIWNKCVFELGIWHYNFQPTPHVIHLIIYTRRYTYTTSRLHAAHNQPLHKLSEHKWIKCRVRRKTIERPKETKTTTSTITPTKKHVLGYMPACLCSLCLCYSYTASVRYGFVCARRNWWKWYHNELSLNYILVGINVREDCYDLNIQHLNVLVLLLFPVLSVCIEQLRIYVNICIWRWYSYSLIHVNKKKIRWKGRKT